MRHRRTDPACIKHRAPRTKLGHWRYDRARGQHCTKCYPQPPWLGTNPAAPWIKFNTNSYG